MPRQDKYEDVSPSALREYSRRFQQCADNLRKLADQMDESQVKSIFVGIIDARQKLERLEKFINAMSAKTTEAVNRVMADSARYDATRKRRKKNDG